ADARLFEIYLLYAGLDTRLQAGDYKLSASSNMIEIAHALQDATPLEVPFVILSGWRLEEIATTLPTSGLSVSADEFLRLSGNPDLLSLPAGLTDWSGLVSLEGFLLPDVYQVRRDITAEALLELILSNFDAKVTPEMRLAFEKQGLTLKQAVTLASIVQREAVVVEEQPVIAAVFLNRLNAGMLLQSDPTVQYALGYNRDKETWWTNPLSAEQLQVQSPYNTYLYPGLPPGPICNPSLSALQAVANPQNDSRYYYFRASCDGSGRHSFASTYEEHLANACQ
ncbi:MAG: endolytic transglycosylase MltG, partial [Anaerolineales bacterium]